MIELLNFLFRVITITFKSLVMVNFIYNFNFSIKVSYLGFDVKLLNLIKIKLFQVDGI